MGQAGPFVKSTIGKVGGFLKDLPGKIVDGAKMVVGKVSDAVGWVKDRVDDVKHMPVIGDIATSLINSNKYTQAIDAGLTAGSGLLKGVSGEINGSNSMADVLKAGQNGYNQFQVMRNASV